MEDDVFETAAAELEASLAKDEKSSGEATDLGKAIVSSITSAVKDVLAKGKGAQKTDLSAEADKRGTLVDSGKDPAESPKKSGQGYKDSSIYEARKGHDDDEDGDDDDGDMPSFFKKKKKKGMGKKKIMKSEDEDEDESDDDEVDATQFVEELGEAVDHLGKSIHRLEQGMAIFGELLSEMADPRKDKLMVNMAKAISHLVTENKDLKKSLVNNGTMMKAISQMPGVPRVAGLQAAFSATEESETPESNGRTSLSKSQRDRLFQLAVAKKISIDDMKKAVSTGDASVLDSFKA